MKKHLPPFKYYPILGACDRLKFLRKIVLCFSQEFISVPIISSSHGAGVAQENGREQEVALGRKEHTSDSTVSLFRDFERIVPADKALDGRTNRTSKRHPGESPDAVAVVASVLLRITKIINPSTCKIKKEKKYKDHKNYKRKQIP